MKNYITGILGGLIGGLLGSLPWVLLYVYGNYILSILAAVIALGVYYGYKLCRGPVNKTTPILVIVFSLIIVSITTLVTMPLLSLWKEGYEVSYYNLTILYQTSEWVSAVISDLVVSIVFTFLGIGGIIAKIKQDIALIDTPVPTEKDKAQDSSVIY